MPQEWERHQSGVPVRTPLVISLGHGLGCWLGCWLLLGAPGCSSGAGSPADAGDGEPDASDSDGGSTDDPGEGAATDGGADDPADPCSRAFAQGFASPLVVAPGGSLLESFSPDCRQLLSVDEAENRLRLTDLVDRTSVDLAAGVRWAEFTPDGSRVIFLTPDGAYAHLWVADAGASRRLASAVGLFWPSDDGTRVAVITGWDEQAVAGALSILSLDDPDAPAYQVASDALGPLRFTRDGTGLLYLGRAVAHHFENPNIACDWHTTELRLAPAAGGPSRLVASEVVTSAYWQSAGDERLYIGTNFNCEAQTFELSAVPLQGEGQPVLLVPDLPLNFPGYFLEVPARGLILHPGAYLGLGYQLLATAVDGSGARELASDLIPSPEFAMAHLPFRVVGDSAALYLQAESLELRAIDLEDGTNRPVASALAMLFYEPSPTGLDVLHLKAAQELFDLQVTPVAGGPTRTLRAGTASPLAPLWAPGGERVLLQADPEGYLYQAHAIDPQTGQAVLLDSATDPLAMAVHPGGWLAVLGRPAGTVVVQIR